MNKLVRITTVPLSLEKLLEGQLSFMSKHFEVLAVSSQEERLKKFGKENNVRTKYINLTRKITPFKDIIALFKMYSFLRKEKPLIVHTHTPKAGIVGMAAAFFARVPIRLHTVAGLPLMEEKGFKKKLLVFIEKLTYAFSTKVYPNSSGLYNFIIKYKFTRPNKLKIIGNGSSNGIDTKYFSTSHFSEVEIEKKREELKIKKQDFVFIFVGRIVKDKGINELVNAFVTLNKTQENSKLLLIGPFEDDLDPLTNLTLHNIKTNENIITTGYKIDVRPYFAVSDALIFPSYREGLPNVVLQAGAMKLPSVVSDINGNNEIITNNKNGLIIPVKDSLILLEAMKKISNNKTLYNDLKQNARVAIETKYNRAILWEQILEEYTHLIKAIK
ncbi:glycosyltransferase family 4 protein [Patiriisocius hiemis]|uniref:Glycosyltransferase family 4 protein n=1 Tax=Patiriisocius hiemis TaxID=3075604 RepID=A0ABU2YEM4_9FLAO|nr:glycosyltransferase family 4 protein [Constantimarinum sp. W242]MDT0556644.1 glycosyltransferase family 4 protein [Constantimarinum sp. W242]